MMSEMIVKKPEDGRVVGRVFRHFDVFLSFRGDLRKKFVDQLYKDLHREGWNVFYDREKMDVGKKINPQLEHAIRHSKLSLVVLSDNYASSMSCLRELTVIMELWGKEEQHVIPVFYEIQVKQVKYQKGKYAKAFADHEREMKRNSEEVKLWRKNLTEIAEIFGPSSKDRYQTEFIADIIKIVKKKLGKQPLLLQDRRDQLVFQFLAGIQKVKGLPAALKAGGKGLKSIFQMAFGFRLSNLGNRSVEEFLAVVGGTPGLVELLRRYGQVVSGDTAITSASLPMIESGLELPIGVVGIKNLLYGINQWAQKVVPNVGAAILLGKQGMGKTTVAKIVHGSNYQRFDDSSVLYDIGETYKTNGLIGLMQKLLNDLTTPQSTIISDLKEGIDKIKAAARRKRLLIIMDDVRDLELFRAILKMRKWLSPGSKVLITTRHNQLLKAEGITQDFEITELDFNDSLKLLCWHAFGQYHPIEDYRECAEMIVRHCSGLPTALKVVGSLLAKLSLGEWKNVLRELKEVKDTRAHKALITSFNHLLDVDKSLFLDIACFFIGEDKDDVISSLEGGGLIAEVAIRSLRDRCFLFEDENNRIKMDEVLVLMGREIVRQEFPDRPGKRTRIFENEDALYVLGHEAGTKSVQCLSIDMRSPEGFQFRKDKKGAKSYQRDVEEDTFAFRRYDCGLLPLCNRLRRVYLEDGRDEDSEDVFSEPNGYSDLKTDAFIDMQNLRLLRLNYVVLGGNYKHFPRKVEWLSWHGFPRQSLPKALDLSHLVALELCDSKIVANWKNGKVLPRLRSLNLSSCRSLRSTPDLMGLPSLERLILRDCLNLTEIDDSIGHTKKLAFLDLSGCRDLRRVSQLIFAPEYVEKLDASGCPMLHNSIKPEFCT